MPPRVAYELVPIEQVEEALLVILFVAVIVVAIWFRIFAYSPDKRYRMNRFNGLVEESKDISAARPELGGFTVWSGVGVAIDKQYILNMWGQRLSVEIEPTVKKFSISNLEKGHP